MPATFIKNNAENSHIHSFYINPTGSNPNLRVFISKTETLNELKSRLESANIPFELEQGSEFIRAAEAKAASAQTWESRKALYAGIENCSCIKVLGLSHFYPLTRHIKFKAVSPRAFYNLLLETVALPPTSIESIEQCKNELNKVLSGDNGPNDFLKDHQDFLLTSLETNAIDAKDYMGLILKHALPNQEQIPSQTNSSRFFQNLNPEGKIEVLEAFSAAFTKLTEENKEFASESSSNRTP